jgi:hypothetical protein
MPNPFFSGENARPNGENTRPNGENTRPRGLTISHNGIYFQERRFSARTATILVFLRSGRNKYHMEDPGMSTNAGLNAYMHIQGPSITAARLGVWPCDNATI